MIIPPSHCPRCDQKWGELQTARMCHQCGMMFSFALRDESGWYRWQIEDKISLFWDIGIQKCIYMHHYTSFTKYQEIELPWLPLTITEQQLQTYLTFF